MKRTKEDTEIIVENILNVSLKYFSEQGYESVNLNEIAEATGSTRGPFYYHFKNKLNLYECTASRYIDWKYSKYEEIFDANLAFFEKIIRYLLFCANLRISESILFIGVDTNPKLINVREKRDKLFKDINDIKVRNISTAIEDGVLKSDTDVQEFMGYFYVVSHGIEAVKNNAFFKAPSDLAIHLVDAIVQDLKQRYENL